jgi:hypothetical protein
MEDDRGSRVRDGGGDGVAVAQIEREIEIAAVGRMSADDRFEAASSQLAGKITAHEPVAAGHERAHARA